MHSHMASKIVINTCKLLQIVTQCAAQGCVTECEELLNCFKCKDTSKFHCVLLCLDI